MVYCTGIGTCIQAPQGACHATIIPYCGSVYLHLSIDLLGGHGGSHTQYPRSMDLRYHPIGSIDLPRIYGSREVRPWRHSTLGSGSLDPGPMVESCAFWHYPLCGTPQVLWTRRVICLFCGALPRACGHEESTVGIPRSYRIRVWTPAAHSTPWIWGYPSIRDRGHTCSRELANPLLGWSRA